MTRRTIRSWFGNALVLVLSIGFPSGVRADDCNRNGVEDSADLAAGTSEDCNLNEVPDECEVAPVLLVSRDVGVPAPRYPRAIRCADIDGDGDADMITANQAGDTLSTIAVTLGDGEGRFVNHEQSPYDNSVRVSSLEVADLDSDGAPDIVTANFFTLELRWNDGGGGFPESNSIEVDRATRFVTVADLDLDGLPDLIATNTSSDEVIVMMNLGDRDFAESARYFVGEYPVSALAVDVDGDDDLDVVVVNRDSDDLSVLSNDGSGALSDVARVTLAAGPSMVTAADLDHDGTADLVVGAEESVTVLFNDGVGGFGAREHVAPGAATIAARDIDSDGDADLVLGAASHSQVTVMINAQGGLFLRPLVFDTEFSPKMMDVCDIDGDRDLDVVVGSTRTVRRSVLWNNDQSAIVIESVRVDMQPAPHAAATGDINGDGFLDYITGDGLGSTISVFLNDQSGNLVLQNSLLVRANQYLNSVDVGDFDGDGDLDAVTGAIQGNRMQVFFNNGSGRFGNQDFYTTGARPFMVEVAELTGDGFPEIVSANENSGNISVYQNRGDGTGTFESRRDYPVGRSPSAVAAGDLNGDGAAELLVANRGSRSFSMLVNNGDGTFQRSTAVPVDGDPWYVSTGDFDSDGDVDVVTANLGRRRVEIFSNRGDGTFEDGRTYDVGGSPYSLRVFDMNVDGVPDILTANQNNDSTSILLNRGDGTFHAGTTYDTGDAPRFCNPGDLDNDGDIDFIAANHDGRDLTVFYNRSPIESRDTHREEICTEQEFYLLSASSRRGRDLKFVLPADPTDETVLPPLFQNSRIFDLHQDFLTEVFPDRFPILGPDEYNRMIGLRETRQYFIGAITQMPSDGGTVYGFSVFVDISEDAGELLEADEVRGIYETLGGVFHLETLAYLPDGIPAREQAAQWEDPGFPIVFDTSVGGGNFEAYTKAVGYGTVRILDSDGFEEANDNGRITFREILVLDHAPRDIEGVVAGVVTAVPQGPLSHLAVRTARRGTPNCFSEGAVSAFTPLDGQLVRLEVSDSELIVEEASLADAEAFWAENQPSLSSDPLVDAEFSELSRLRDIDLSQPGVAESRFGGKASNFARLQRVLTGDFTRYQEVGFAIPVHYYVEFMRTNQLLSFVTPLTIVTYEEYLDELYASPEFQSDSSFRFRALEQLRGHMETSGVVPDELVSQIVTLIDDVFGSTTDRVRFRSSSNVEDGLEFNGAGLYSSLSACAADELDDDEDGPSRCGGDGDERGVPEALRRVWASLWNFRAFEERSYYQIPQSLAAMGVLVSRAFVDELANGVAFTGNPRSPLDGRYLIASQTGETSVVSPDPGVLPARDVLVVEEDGRGGGALLEIVRASGSSLLPEDTHVLREDELRELSALLWHVDRSFPIDLGEHDRSEVVLDFEFKIESNGELAVKQVRTFLRTEPLPPSPVFEVRVAEGVEACVGFGSVSLRRDPESVLELKAHVRLRAGDHELATDSLVSRLDLIDELRFGPDARVLESTRPGLLRASRFPNSDGTTRHGFIFDQVFSIDDDRELQVSLSINDTFTARGDRPIRGILVFNELYVESGMSLVGTVTSVSDPDRRRFVDFSSCRYESLDLWELAADLQDGSTISILERFQLPEPTDLFGPVRVQRATVNLRGVNRRVDSYWQLVYSAARHNTFMKHWVLFDRPVVVGEFERPVAVVELTSTQTNSEGDILQEPGARYLDAEFQEIASVAVTAHTFGLYEEPLEPLFLRGDYNADGETNLTDAVAHLNFLVGGGEAPTCARAADSDDNGRLEVTDAIRTLDRLFRGGEPLADPVGECGVDPTADGLECEAYSPCE